ncbi:MAG TPA: acyl-CoA dehydrogenase [Burkholderiaceae bacterium]|nr:acyl-CoA dehydrogenase [Burkholderiaceae bacterium]
MTFVLTEEQTLLRDSARTFLAEKGPVAQLRRLRDTRDADGFSRPLWKSFIEMGYTAMLVPEAHGGLGLGHGEVGLLMQEIGRHLTASPFLASGVVAVSAILQGADTAQQARLLPPLARGEVIATLAVDEISKHRPDRIALRAARAGEGWRLGGQKTFVLDGHVADWLLVAARTEGATDDAHGIALFVVPRLTPGIEVERVIMVDAHNAARVRFADVAVGADALLCGAQPGAVALRAALDAGRVAVAAEMLGIADEVFARTLAYLKERKQFDRRIGEFQALQHRAAMLYCDIELARAAVAHAATRLDAGAGDAWAAAAVAKARAGSSVTRAVQEAVQMHGGMGMTDELDLGLFMKRARVLQELFGDAAFHADRLAVSRGY